MGGNVFAEIFTPIPAEYQRNDFIAIILITRFFVSTKVIISGQKNASAVNQNFTKKNFLWHNGGTFFEGFAKLKIDYDSGYCVGQLLIQSTFSSFVHTLVDVGPAHTRNILAPFK